MDRGNKNTDEEDRVVVNDFERDNSAPFDQIVVTPKGTTLGDFGRMSEVIEEEELSFRPSEEHSPI